jgi:RNA polymerase sigma factor (sigma-70 family)
MTTDDDRCTDTTDELVRAFTAGDRAALDALVRRFHKVPIAAARRYLRSFAEVEDVAQETWLRFTLHAGRLRHPERLAGWLWATAANEALRRAKAAARTVSVDRFDDLAAVADEDPLLPERRRAVRIAVRTRLSAPEQRLWALLAHEDGLDYATIARTCERPVGAIGPTRARIVGKLRADPGVARLRAW